MQPKDPANHHPRDQFVLLDSSDGEIAALIDGALEAVPYARGANNHMGSLLTSNEAAARRVLAALKARGLFFVDSKTAPTTVAYAQARRLRVPTALRDVFLDDEPTYEHAAAQLRPGAGHRPPLSHHPGGAAGRRALAEAAGGGDRVRIADTGIDLGVRHTAHGGRREKASRRS